MADTNILLDLVTDDPDWAGWSLARLEEAALAGPVFINDVVYAETSIRYSRMEDLDAMLVEAEIDIAPTSRAALFLAGKAFQRYRMAGGTRTGVLPDFFIGAHASVEGWTLLTRDGARYRTLSEADGDRAMSDLVERIAVVQGAPSAVVQDVFRLLVDRWQPFVRLAGAIAEDHGLPDRACAAGYLRSLGNGERFAIFQDLGPGAKTCHLDGDGASAAAAAVRRDIARGCDIVVLSKFGKLEAAGGGLRDAFAAAIEAGVPVLTSVSPAFATAWQAFATPLSVVVPADADRIDAWWHAVRPV